MMKFWDKTKGWKLPILGLIGVVYALVVVFSRTTQQVKAPYQEPPTAQFKQNVGGLGILEPVSEFIQIGVDIPGIVRKLYVQAGDFVKTGDPLFTLDEKDIKAKIATLEAVVVSAEINLENTRTLFETVSNLKDMRAVSKDLYNQRKYGYELAQANLVQVFNELRESLITLEKLTVRAPIDGQILQNNVHLGEYASAGELPTPLMLMGDMSQVNVRVDIDQENISRVSSKGFAKGFLRGNTERVILLMFVRFEHYVQPKVNLPIVAQRVDTRVMQIIYALPKGEEDVWAGQQMDVFIEDLNK